MNCLFNEKVIPLLLSMDSDTLLDCGRASLRLYRLVSHRQVWRSLLKNVSEFSEEKVGELVVFVKEGGPCMRPETVKGSPEMLQEVLKEAARRIKFCDQRDQRDRRQSCKHPSHQGTEEGIIQLVKITVTVQGWGCETFEVDGTRLEELTELAEALGEKFTMVEVQDYNSMKYNIDTFKKIATHMEKQEEKLVRLETPNVHLTSLREIAEIFLVLQERCIEWKVTICTMGSIPDDDPDYEEHWACFDQICTKNGHISILFFYKSQGTARLESVRKAWEISGMMNILSDDLHLVTLRGGRDADDLEAEWQQVVEALQ